MRPTPGPEIFRFFARIVLLACASAAFAQSPQSTLKFTPEQDSQVHDLLSKVLQHTQKVGCKNVPCKILVTNFTDPDGNTSKLGMQLADRISYDAIFPLNRAQTIDPDRLLAYLVKERISARSLNDPIAQLWLIREFSADALLVGHISQIGTKLSIQIQLVGHGKSFNSGARRSAIEQTTISYAANAEDLGPAEPFRESLEVVIDGETVEKWGANQKGDGSRMTPPRCTYKPDPPYTDAARAAKYQGIVILQTVISKDGRMLDVRPLHGAPFGLNRVSVDTVRTWRCSPPTITGKPLIVTVPVEISFRLF